MSGASVSVIVPFYGAERFLREAVESAVAQSHRPLEVILVDDGSTDGGWAVAATAAAEYADVRALRLGERRGPAAARNHALAEARGELLTFLDADNVMLPGRLARQVAYLAEHPDVDVVVCAEEALVEADAPLALLARRRSRGPGPHFHLMSMMVRRAAFERVGPFDPSYFVAEDLDWLFRAAAAGLAVGKVDAVGTRLRLHADNLSFRTGDIQRGMLRSLRRGLVERRAR